MTFIVKPLVTEKMTKITDKSSVDKQLRALNPAAAQRLGAKEEKISYTVKSKNKGERQKEKTIFTYTKPACRKYGFIVKPEANKLEIKKEIEELYNVTVLDVNTIKYAGKRQSRYASVPEKSLVYGKRSTGGRNNTGKMTVRYRGGGHKKKFRMIDFKREKDGVPAVVKTIEYDPKGTVIHNIELRPGQGAKLVRSAGNFAQLTSREGDYCVIKLPSGETRKVLSACKATVGAVGNSDHALEASGKAGRSRWLGRRPHNRGVVMNPVDHPMGGGEGRQSGGHPRSRKGLYAKGLKTRAPKKLSNKYIIERANKK